MIRDEILAKLHEMQDTAYRDFQKNLIPDAGTERFIGVRTPRLRAYAKQLKDRPDLAEFLGCLPHAYFDEDQLHAFILSDTKDYERCMAEVCRFLPYVNNWATCDQMSPKVFRKHRDELLEQIREWLRSGHTYTVRFGIGMLMEHYLDEDFREEYLDMAVSVHHDAYYVRMMQAWYVATALAKQYDAAVRVLAEDRLDAWTHNKAIQKAVESRRISDERKAYLKTLKRKGEPV